MNVPRDRGALPGLKQSIGKPSMTIFTTAKPFCGLHEIIQTNALRSWSCVRGDPEILLIGDEVGYEQAALAVGARRVTTLERNEFGTPLVSNLFEQGRSQGTGDILVYVNADIILPPRFSQAIETIAGHFKRFLVVGRRIDLDVTAPIDFENAEWYERLESRIADEGNERGGLCIDWFAFDRSTLSRIPPFAIGRTRYDNWIVWRAANEGATVVDASEYVKVVHQNHDYKHVGSVMDAWEGPEARRAEQLLGHWSHYHSIGHAKYELDTDCLVRKASRRKILMATAWRTTSHALRFSRPWRRRFQSWVAVSKLGTNPATRL